MKTNKKYIKEFKEFADVVHHENPNISIDDLLQLCVLAGRANRYNIKDCNYGLTGRQRTMSDKVDNEALEIVKTFGNGFTLNLNGDPRGYAYKLALPSGRYNTMGGSEDGWGIPEL